MKLVFKCPHCKEYVELLIELRPIIVSNKHSEKTVLTQVGGDKK